MKKRTGILTATLMIAMMLLPSTAFAAASSVSISGGGSIQAGKTATVTVTYKGTNLGYVYGQLTYDTSRLEYVSGGSSQGDAGLVELKSYAGDASGKLSFKVKFKAKSAGSVNLNLETIETQNLDGDQSMGTPSASRRVKVTVAKETAQATTKETTAATTEPQVETMSPAEQESSENTASEASETKISYPVLGGITAVLIVLIVFIAIRLRKRKKR